MFENFIANVKGVAFNAKTQLVAHSPEILLGAGLVSICVGTVMACKATLKLDELKEKAENDLNRIEEGVVDAGIDYSEAEADQDRDTVTKRYIGGVIANYAPSVGMIALGLTLTLLSHKILKDRNATLLSAYTALQTAYTAYRERNIARNGEESDLYCQYGAEKQLVQRKVVNPETGEEEVVEREEMVLDREFLGENGYLLGNPYARVFDADHTTEYEKNDPDNCVTFSKLQIRERQWNEVLKLRAKCAGPGGYGVVFGNEVYHDLGFDKCALGQVDGWVLGYDQYKKDAEAGKDDMYIKFNMFSCYSRPELANLWDEDETGRRVVVLDFNMQPGVIKHFGSGLPNELSEEDCNKIYYLQNK